MTRVIHYGYPMVGLRDKKLPGKLIVVEGTDGVGRSTQIALLREWLEANGYATTETGLIRSNLAGAGIKKAKRGHTMGDLTMNLFYSTDFVDRLEKQIIPALRAGFVVLTDRYIYSIIARAQVRGVDPKWIRDVLGFALIPDVVFYLRIDVENLIPRVVNSGGFDYWESGMDYLRRDDIYSNYIKYQTEILKQFDGLAKEYHFHVVDANAGVPDVFCRLRDALQIILSDMQPAMSVGLGDKPPKTEKKQKTNDQKPEIAKKARPLKRAE